MPTRQQALAKILPAHPAIVQFDDEPMHRYESIPTEGRGHGVPIPWYCAGFFLHPTWMNPFVEQHDITIDLENYILELPGGQAIDDSLQVVSYFDEDNCVFLSMHDNIVDGKDTTDWLERRDEQLDLLCTLLELSEIEVEMVKANFAWHIMRPRVYDCVPVDLTLYVPSELEEYRFYACPY